MGRSFENCPIRRFIGNECGGGSAITACWRGLRASIFYLLPRSALLLPSKASGGCSTSSSIVTCTCRWSRRVDGRELQKPRNGKYAETGVQAGTGAGWNQPRRAPTSQRPLSSLQTRVRSDLSPLSHAAFWQPGPAGPLPCHGGRHRARPRLPQIVRSP